MKKLTLIALMALVMLGFTQCKKETPAESNLVDITFTATRGDAKTSISPLGTVEFVAGDKIHVYGRTSGYRGYLTYTSGAKGSPATFSGTITQWTDGENIRFIYIGSDNDSRVASDGSITINFADQTYEGTQTPENDLANIAHKFNISQCQISSVSTSTTEFSGELENLIAIAIFNTSAFSDGTNVKFFDTHTDGSTLLKNSVYISGKGGLNYYVAGISRSTSSGVYQNYQSGSIVIGSGQPKRYVALLPMGLDTQTSLSLKFTSNGMVSTSDIPMTFSRNNFLYEGDFDGITIPAASVISQDYVDLAESTNHVFSVSNGKTVKFSKGNLVYDQGRFKMHSEQYGKCFTQTCNQYSSPNMRDLIRVYQTFDLFRWGTSGWNSGCTNYMPHAIDNNSGYYGPRANGNYVNLYDTDNNKADWGTYQFGMNASNTAWRVLTKEEWTWLLGPASNPDPGNNCRTSATVNGVANARYVKAVVNDVNGLIIFPDDYRHPRVPNPVGVNDQGNHWTNSNSSENNIYTDTEWTLMQEAGAVFLPAAGESVQSASFSDVGKFGGYWSSSFGHYDSANNAILGYSMKFNTNTTNPNNENNYVTPSEETNAKIGLTVRLVVDAN